MRSLLLTVMAVAMLSILAHAQTGPPRATNSSPISQPLIREGTLAVKLAGDLKLGTTENEAEAEDLLSSADITPRNGWIADYPVTPDIVGELQAAIAEAADAGKVSIRQDAALQALQTDVRSFMLPLTPDTSGKITDDMSAPSYPDANLENAYYNSDGPPTVTYYAPPADYAYMYDWVPYPFWWSDFWFPGFFVLTDFHIKVHRHDHGHEHDGFVTNHFRDPRTGEMQRVDPANRFRHGTFPAGGRTGWTSPAARIGANAVSDRSRGQIAPAPLKGFRGYELSPSPGGARSSAFHHSFDRQTEHAASDRGFQSRSSAGQTPAAIHSGGGVSRGGGAGTYRGGGSGGGFHGGGHR